MGGVFRILNISGLTRPLMADAKGGSAAKDKQAAEAAKKKAEAEKKATDAAKKKAEAENMSAADQKMAAPRRRARLKAAATGARARETPTLALRKQAAPPGAPPDPWPSLW